MLARITRTVRPGGNIASVGLAGGHRLETTVMPFLLRGVSLLGINTVDVPSALRQTLWDHLATDWRPPHLESIATGTIRLEGLPNAFERMLAGRTHGRILVTLGAA
jgi:acrylyl-CoA reductase (NADPH)